MGGEEGRVGGVDRARSGGRAKERRAEVGGRLDWERRARSEEMSHVN